MLGIQGLPWMARLHVMVLRIRGDSRIIKRMEIFHLLSSWLDLKIAPDVQHIPFFLQSWGAPLAPFFCFFSFNTTFLLGHTGLYETEHPSPKKLTFLFLGLEGWDQHRCNPLARLPLANPAQALLLAPAGNCRACVGSQLTPLACTSSCTGCVALFLNKNLVRGCPPTAQEKWDWLYLKKNHSKLMSAIVLCKLIKRWEGGWENISQRQ
jgi:hypothetical protein